MDASLSHEYPFITVYNLVSLIVVHIKKSTEIVGLHWLQMRCFQGSMAVDDQGSFLTSEEAFSPSKSCLEETADEHLRCNVRLCDRMHILFNGEARLRLVCLPQVTSLDLTHSSRSAERIHRAA